MRTPEVEIAISNTKAGMYCTDDADTLAAEVERLEAENKSQQSGMTALRANHDDLQRLYAEIKEACAQEGMERYCTHEHLMAFLKSRLLAGTQIISINETMSVVRRAEAAEARVAELEAQVKGTMQKCGSLCGEGAQ